MIHFYCNDIYYIMLRWNNDVWPFAYHVRILSGFGSTRTRCPPRPTQVIDFPLFQMRYIIFVQVSTTIAHGCTYVYLFDGQKWRRGVVHEKKPLVRTGGGCTYASPACIRITRIYMHHKYYSAQQYSDIRRSIIRFVHQYGVFILLFSVSYRKCHLSRQPINNITCIHIYEYIRF